MYTEQFTPFFLKQDSNLMGYRAPHQTVDFLNANFSGSREQVLVLDVACGSGWVAKLVRQNLLT